MERELEKILNLRDKYWGVFLSLDKIEKGKKAKAISRFEGLMYQKHGSLKDVGAIKEYLMLYIPRFERYMSRFYGLDFNKV